MTPPRGVAFLLYDGFELLDLAGPAGVFDAAGALEGRPRYQLALASARGGPVASGCGAVVETRPAAALRPGRRDTVLVVGALREPLERALRDRALTTALRGLAGRAGRLGSVCSGAFLLGAAGLLAGRRVATHWSACQALGGAFPDLEVDPEALYVEDGGCWTSAGVTAGLDMALAMLERDCGPALKARVARHLVVYAHRPGNQSQFSAVAEAQAAGDGAFSELVAWLDAHLEAPIRVGQMAARAGMSERTFHRRFTAATGATPARFLDALRLQRARDHLERGAPAKQVAGLVGFRSQAAFRAAFRARLGVPPGQYARLHARARP